MNKLFVVLIFCGVYANLFSQNTRKTYPSGYFQWPVGAKKEIVANMGELRSNHWHMGLDIRTDQVENRPVYAAAEGYIAHIGIRPQSFGRFIVINHPNGLSTLYGHLNKFYDALEDYVTEQQYKKESWSIEIGFSKDQFRVAKGQFIANSGNTGGSQGPHVHFEIFDTKTTKRLNPLLFGFPLEDKVPPDLVKLAIYDRSLSVYEQTPQFLALKKTDSGYIIPQKQILQTGLNKLSFAIQAYDRMSGSNNADGIYSAKLSIDEGLASFFVIDSISYEETAYMNAHIDYRLKYNGGAFLQHLSRLPGDFGGVYRDIAGDGVLELTDTALHSISIDIRDAYNNISRLDFFIQYSDSLAALKDAMAGLRETFTPTQVNMLEKNDFEVYLQEGCLYDTMHPFYLRRNSSGAYAVSASHQLNDGSIPLHADISVRIKPDRPIPDDWKDRLLIQRSGRGTSNKVAEWQDQWLSARFGDLGSFQAFADVIAPTINAPGKGDTINLSPASRIVFTPSDNFGIKSFRAEINGQWIRFTNDKSRNWIYIFDERVPYGVHELKVTVVDLVGNTTTKSWWFKKYPYKPPPKKKYIRKKTVAKKKPAVKKKN